MECETDRQIGAASVVSAPDQREKLKGKCLDLPVSLCSHAQLLS